MTVNNAEFSNDDIPVTITCKVGEIESSVTITVLAEHHLVYESNNESHWQVCTDAECGYTTAPDRHVRDDQWDFDGQYHFHACDVCGAGKVDVSEHNFKLYAGGWYIDDGRCSDCGYNLYTVENGIITKYNGQIAKLQIPSQINGEQITGIGESAFAKNLYVQEVELPDTVTVIGNRAFEGCANLVRVDLGEGITILPMRCFEDCASLEKIEMGQITSIKAYALRNCSSLATFTIPNTLQEIQASVFSGVSAEILWGDAPQLVILDGFQGYLGTSFTIPSNITVLNSNCFEGSNLIGIIVPDTVVDMKGGAHFMGCENLKWVEISSKIIACAAGSTFNGCTSLEYVLLKSPKFWHFSGSVFYNCPSLKAVYIRTPMNVLRTQVRFIEGGQHDDMVGKLYGYVSKENTVLHPDFGTEWTKYFGGTWYYDETGIESLEHVVNGQEALRKEAAPVNSITLICDFKRRESL